MRGDQNQSYSFAELHNYADLICSSMLSAATSKFAPEVQPCCRWLFNLEWIPARSRLQRGSRPWVLCFEKCAIGLAASLLLHVLWQHVHGAAWR